ncbi:MAG TPA: hypothetical protein VKE69_01340, partial [Planctomycetota bacterium]|nr:hypothetical protein [Planctomycetota bacterium]
MKDPSTSALSAHGAAPRTRSFVAVVTWLQAYVIVGAAVSLVGWVMDVHALADWDDDGITIQPNASLAALASGIAVLSLARGYRLIAAILGAFVAFVGVSALFQLLTDVDLGIDTVLMFERTWGRVGVTSPGRMGPPGATSWALIGLGIILATGRRGSSARRITPAFALITALISALGLIGYLYGASPLYALPSLTIIALQTASFIFAASIGLLLCVPEHGAIRLLGENTPGGILARRIVPAIVLIPILLGFIRLVGDRSGLYDGSFGSALRTLLEIVLFVVF